MFSGYYSTHDAFLQLRYQVVNVAEKTKSYINIIGISVNNLGIFFYKRKVFNKRND